MKHYRYRAGDRVTVRSAEEILSTLDSDGTLGGLPFMPEMLEWCGRSFRVQRRAEKTCVDVAPPIHPIRRFAANDVVFLEGPRCDGRGHDGCKRGCRIFWKEDWLRPVGAEPATERSVAGPDNEPRARLKVKSDENRYLCQSTELCRATEAFPGRLKPWMLRVLIREIQNGDRSVSEVLKLFVLWSLQRLHRVALGKQWLRGPHRRTPTESLGLERGDVVRVKNRFQIEATLDRNRRNRGLGICYEMTRYCGGWAEVRDRVDRMIDERTGAMRDVNNTVTLRSMRGKRVARELECLCYDALGDCPRGELMFWREIWLEHADDSRP